MKILSLCGALCAASALPALAQGQVNPANQNNRNGAVFQLPPDVKNVVSIDAQNMLIIESETDGQTQYSTQIIKHVYSGGIALLFGGSVVPTAQFVSPAGLGMAQGNQNVGGAGGSGVTGAGGGFGAGVGGNGNFGGTGFGGGAIQGAIANGAIARGNFTGQGRFNTGLFNGTIATNGGVTNLRISPR